MKKIYLLGTLLACTLSFGQVFTGTYTFASVTTTSGLTDPTPVPTAAGMTFGSFSAVNPVATNSTGTGRFSFTDQPLGATPSDNVYANLVGLIDLTNYMEVTVTPNAGTTYNLTGVTFRHQRSGTGVRTYSVRSSADGYAANLPASISPANTELSVETGNIFFRVLDATTTGQNGSTITLSGASFTGLTTAVTFRFYGWNAEATTGSNSIDDVAISGNVTILSRNSFDAISGLKIYPNPVKNLLNITSDSFEAKTVAIYNVLGKVVLSEKVTNAPVNVANLAKGVYVVKVTEEGKTATRKLVIE
ncbi:Por secretion system C-terminal sorting domain-containing protein [Flavobacterium swingsii]|uniref:Por secretion system C-terminal sorting domain-containing protein n=1 Tax=Flavobacterium swingsii TaxID=498292 RepID=A0A1I0XIC7_9FLAO|nr:T9SS type A sorting domain-containing protein [Flavobacterium swingsii]SFB00772.1 Por secretion system C-terminal sorting domain-containing protein [Flavobacterium swingsii]